MTNETAAEVKASAVFYMQKAASGRMAKMAEKREKPWIGKHKPNGRKWKLQSQAT